jgi:hypothetical protein
MRTAGDHDFCDLLFPVDDGHCLLEVGGWQEDLVGLDTVDGLDPRQNGTGVRMQFEQEQWYSLRVRVAGGAIAVWVDGEQIIDLPTAGHEFAADPKWAGLRPVGLGTAWGTGAAVRRVELRRLAGPPPSDTMALVLGNAQWHDSGIELLRGQCYEITAIGIWGHAPRSTVGPDGNERMAERGFPMPGTSEFCLIGRVGSAGAPFVIGKRATVTPQETGPLCLQMNDSTTEDNTGSLRVTVETVQR